jgi:hypothetical protein
VSSALSSESSDPELTCPFHFFPVVAFREPFEPFEDCPLSCFEGPLFDGAYFAGALVLFAGALVLFLVFDLAIK